MDLLKKFIKNNNILYKLVIVINRIFYIFKNLMFKVMGYTFIYTMPIKDKKVVVCNFYGKGYGCNPKYIVEEIIKQNLNYNIVWMVNDINTQKDDFPKEIKLVKYGTIRALYELSTAKIWIDNSRKHFYPPKKRKSQYYIQTWHGGIGVKAVEKSVQNNLSKGYIKNAINDSKMADLFISNSKWCTKLYKENFWYNGEILECGSPRVDILFNENTELKNKIFKLYNLDGNKNIMLYAPTFRNSMDINIYKLDYEKCIEALKNKFSGEWIIFIRLHPNIAHLSDKITCDKNVINVTKYSDMQELLSISDILITDFSGSMFEFSYLKKPIFIYTEDYEEYKKERSFTMDIDNLPFRVNQNNEELINDINEFCEVKYNKDLEKMLCTFELKEYGTASKQIVDKIKQLI